MSADWPVIRLGELCDLMTGGTPTSSDPANYFGGQIPWLVSGDVHQGEIIECGGRITEVGLANSNARWLPINTVIIALNGQGKTRGTVALLRMRATCNQSLVSITPKDTSVLTPEFLFWNLRGRYEEIRRMTGDDGNERRGLNMHLIRSIQVPVPSVVEQRRMVGLLNEAFGGIAVATENAERSRSNADAYFRLTADAAFQPQAGWKTSTLAGLGRLTTGNTPKSSSLGSYGGDVPFIKPGDFRRDGTLNYENESLTELGIKQSRMMPAGSALMVCIGATIGKTGFTVRDICANQQVNAFSAGPQVSARFVFHQMRTSRFQTDVMRDAGQATLPIISKSKWGALQIFFPSFAEQERIVEMLDDLRREADRLVAIYDHKLAALAELKLSLLAHAFSGELTRESLAA